MGGRNSSRNDGSDRGSHEIVTSKDARGNEDEGSVSDGDQIFRQTGECGKDTIDARKCICGRRSSEQGTPCSLPGSRGKKLSRESINGGIK